MKLISRHMALEKMEAIYKNLPSLQQAQRADHDWRRVAPVLDGAGPNRDFRLGLAYLEALLSGVRAVLPLQYVPPIGVAVCGNVDAEEIDDLAHGMAARRC